MDLFGAASDDVDLSQSDSLPARWGVWRRQYPPRPYVGVPLQTVGGARGLPKDASEQILGGVYTQLAPDADSKSLLVSAEFVLVPLAQKIAEGQETLPVGIHDELFVYVDPASGEKFQHTTNMHRMWALAQTHPLVDTIYATATSAVVSGVLEEERALDERGRAIAGEQGEFAMSLSLSVSSLEFVLGLTTRNVAESMVALWWRPAGPVWTERARMGPAGLAVGARRAAQQVFLDLAELGCAAIPPQEHEASMGLSLSGYNPYVQAAEEDAKGESRRPDAEEEGGPLRAATGAWPSSRPPPRQVSFRDLHVAWPLQQEEPWHTRMDNVKLRRQRALELTAVLKRECLPVPSPSEFITESGTRTAARRTKPSFSPCPFAFASTKVRLLAELRTRLDGVGLASKRFFCDAFPSLQPGSGGVWGPECVSRDHPVWETLQKEWGVSTVPDFLKHICNKHDGEARLIAEGPWMCMPADVDVRDPAFWSPQFARTPESRHWLAKRLLRWRSRDLLLNMEEVDWVLSQRSWQTLLIRKDKAVSGAPVFQIRTGTVVTLAEMYYYGVDLCTAFDIYKLYLDLPLFIHKISHPEKRRRVVGWRPGNWW